MRFCQAFMTELYHHIEADIDVGGREVGDMAGMMKMVLRKKKLERLMEYKKRQRGSLKEYANLTNTTFFVGERPWHIPVDIALPCAVENELDLNHAKQLTANGVICVAKGANIPTTLPAIQALQQAKVLYAPGKASNAGGVAISGLEMCQEAQRLQWDVGPRRFLVSY